MDRKVRLRSLEDRDVAEVMELFHDTVHGVNIRDYTGEQADAWAPPVSQLSEDAWKASFLGRHAVVAEADGRILGFCDVTPDGYLDRFYVHSLHQREGIGSLMYEDAEAFCRSRGLKEMTVHASITALPFFLSRGYGIIKEQTVERRGISLKNFSMKKDL